MNHNLTVLTTVAQADQFLTKNLVEKSDLEYKQATATNAIATRASSATAIAADLATAQAELTLLNSLLAATPEGESRNDLLDDINDLENDIIRLNRRAETNGPVAQFWRELDLEFAGLFLTACNDIQTQVESRKAELLSAAP